MVIISRHAGLVMRASSRQWQGLMTPALLLQSQGEAPQAQNGPSYAEGISNLFLQGAFLCTVSFELLPSNLGMKNLRNLEPDWGKY